MSTPRFSPVSDRVIILEDNAKEKFRNTRIIIPENAREKPTIGTLLAIGPGSQRKTGSNKHEMSELEVGKKYVFSKHAGFHFKIEQVTYLAIRRQDIHAEITPEIQADT